MEVDDLQIASLDSWPPFRRLLWITLRNNRFPLGSEGLCVSSDGGQGFSGLQF